MSRSAPLFELKRNELCDQIDQSRTPARRMTLIVHRHRTPSHAGRAADHDLLPWFVLPLLPPGAGDGGSTHGV
jgi:hypothetical protein